MRQRFAGTKPGVGYGGGKAQWAERVVVAALGLLAVAGSRGCTAAGPDPGPSPRGPFCGDGVCSRLETAITCPGDCAAPVRCGDGVCAAGETYASCPADCAGACVAACQAIDLQTLVPAVIRDTTASDPASTDEATCGDGATGPLRRYRLSGLPPGRYRVSASGTFDVVIDARSGTCGGDQLGCAVAYAGSAATFVLTPTSAQTVIVSVAGLAGGAGDFTLDITPEPVCGDLICQDETCSSCPADCGVCPARPVCGDGRCDVGETCGSCAADCGSCGPVCGDGWCDVGETCGSCAADCGSCGPVCGDGWCDAGETCGSCAADCGSCGPSCGDGICDFGENCTSCSFDCGSCAATCGDGSCDVGEDCSSCSFDCGACPGPDPSGLKGPSRGAIASGPSPNTTARR